MAVCTIESQTPLPSTLIPLSSLIYSSTSRDGKTRRPSIPPLSLEDEIKVPTPRPVPRGDDLYAVWILLAVAFYYVDLVLGVVMLSRWSQSESELHQGLATVGLIVFILAWAAALVRSIYRWVTSPPWAV